MNKFIATGNLTTDPEISYSKSGKSYARFTLAVPRARERDKADFFRCVCFGKIAENLVNYQRKGNKLFIEGEIQIEKGNDGKYYTNIIVHTIEYLTPKGSKDDNFLGGTSEDDYVPAGFMPADGEDDELPF